MMLFFISQNVEICSQTFSNNTDSHQDDAEWQTVTSIEVSSLFYCRVLQPSNLTLE